MSISDYDAEEVADTLFVDNALWELLVQRVKGEVTREQFSTEVETLIEVAKESFTNENGDEDTEWT
jgi:hypothetical protein